MRRRKGRGGSSAVMLRRAPLVPRMGKRAAGQSATRHGTWRPTASAVHHSETCFCQRRTRALVRQPVDRIARHDYRRGSRRAGRRANPPSCRVTATVTHPPAGDRINVFIGLPLKSWNGRFPGCRRRRLLRRERKRHSAAALRRLRRRCDRHRPRGWEWKLRARCERPSELARGQGQCVSRHP